MSDLDSTADDDVVVPDEDADTVVEDPSPVGPPATLPAEVSFVHENGKTMRVTRAQFIRLWAPKGYAPESEEG